MILNDKITMSDSLKGYFSIRTINRDGTEELYEDHNLIMDNARYSMAKAISGYESGRKISVFKLGTAGNVSGEYLRAKTSAEGFVSSRTSLFSEAKTGEITYYINFGSSIKSKQSTQTIATTSTSDSQECSVKITVANRVVTYEVTIPEVAANQNLSGVSSIIPYTEAALYTWDSSDSNPLIFSAKTFPVKVKEDTVSMVATWSITF
jgi:hypothetical protein